MAVLTQSQVAKVTARLQMTECLTTCSACKAREEWAVDPVLVEMRGVNIDRSSVLSSPVAAMVRVACKKCGLVSMFDVVTLGIAAKTPQSTDQSPAPITPTPKEG